MKPLLKLNVRLTFSVVVGLFLLNSPLLFAQDTSSMALQEFAAVYTTGENWDEALSPAEQPYFIQHSLFLSNLRKTGVITAGMRVAEMGIVLVKAKNIDEARKLFEKDISVSEKTFKLDIQPATVFYKGCLGE